MCADIVSRSKRRAMMQAVRQKGTDIEVEVRRIIRGLGHRGSANSSTLPGRPDYSNKRARWAVFVHGCFWHGHADCPKTKGGKAGRIPASNRPFWSEKIAGNRLRDDAKSKALRQIGFRVLTVWECEVRDTRRLSRKLERFFSHID